MSGYHYFYTLPFSLPRPVLMIPDGDERDLRHFAVPAPVMIAEYFAVSDGKKRVYTDEDGMNGYGSQKILPPGDVSLYSLYINGILQPKANYEVKAGKLFLKTDDVPLRGTPIILQMIIL